MDEKPEVVAGGGPREGSEAKIAPNPNPDAVHPDFLPATPGAPTPPETAEPAAKDDDE